MSQKSLQGNNGDKPINLWFRGDSYESDELFYSNVDVHFKLQGHTSPL